MEENVVRGEAPKLRGRQLLTALSPLLSVFILGLTYGFGTVIMSELTSPYARRDGNSSRSDEFGIDRPSEAFWIVPGNIVPMIPCCWLSGILMERFGRKKLLVLAPPLFITGWLLIGFADTFQLLTIGRLICSIPAGLVIPLVPVYLGEISDPHFRGFLLGSINASVTFGMLISNCLSLLMSWRGNALACAGFSLISWLTSAACRESPVWLMNRDQLVQGERQWVHFRGRESLDEYRAMRRVPETDSQGNGNRKRSKVARVLGTLCCGQFLWPLAVLCVLSFVHHFAGLNVVGFIGVNAIMTFVGFQNSGWANFIMIMGIFIVAVVACFAILRYGRRTLAMVSAVGTVCTLFLGSFFFLVEIDITGIVQVCVWFHVLFVSMGLMPLSWVLVGELFPREWRSLGAGLVGGFSAACLFADVKMATNILMILYPSDIFLFYAITTLVGTILLYWKLPETKDKTLVDLEVIFEKRSEENHDQADIEMIETGT